MELSNSGCVLEKALVAATGSDDVADISAMDFVIVFFLAAVLLACLWRRLRTTLIVLALWTAWFVSQYCKGEASWQQVVCRAMMARENTKKAVWAAWFMLVSWFSLLFPPFELLLPVITYIWGALVAWWTPMPLPAKLLAVALLLFAMIGGWLLLVLCRCIRDAREKAKDRAQQAKSCAQECRARASFWLFHLSIVGVGPLIWWFTMHVPADWAFAVVPLVQSFVPLCTTIAALRARDKARVISPPVEEQQTQKGFLTSWLPQDFQEPDQPIEECLSEGLIERLKWQLSYWSIWPVFALTSSLLDEFINDDSNMKQSAYGVFLAVIVWAQFWHGSRISPWIFAMSNILLGGCTEKLSVVSTAVSNKAKSYAGNYAGKVMLSGGSSGGRKGKIVMGLLAVVIVGTVVLKALYIVSVVLTYAIILGAAFDSASIVWWERSELYPARLAFWVLAIALTWLCKLPLVGSLLEAWTPAVLLAALVVGPTMLEWTLWLCHHCANACLKCLGWSTEEDSPPGLVRDAEAIGGGTKTQPLLPSIGFAETDSHITSSS